jgi:hypothetical protein
MLITLIIPRYGVAPFAQRRLASTPGLSVRLFPASARLGVTPFTRNWRCRWYIDRGVVKGGPEVCKFPAEHEQRRPNCELY